jgi:hypothetical protein
MKMRGILLPMLFAALACSPKQQPAPDLRAATVVQVDNQGFSDMAIYVARGPQRQRLGTATGNSKTTFNVPASLMSGLTQLHFVADPIGGRRASVSEEITVAPGDTVVLQIPPA